MRIIAGKAGRTAIKVPSAVARPTTDYVRQAVFSILGETVFNARILDLFCGSGALGLEALSRGAASCVFVDDHRQAISATEANLAKSKLEGGRVIRSDAFSYLSREAAIYDLIFADPPYRKSHGDTDHLKKLLELPGLPGRLADGGYLVAEISSSQTTPDSPSLALLERRQYGSSTILIYAHPES